MGVFEGLGMVNLSARRKVTGARTDGELQKNN